METAISKKALFNASCIALIVTAMTFAIRAGILVELGNDFNLNNTQLGWINSMAFSFKSKSRDNSKPLFNTLSSELFVNFKKTYFTCTITILNGY